MTALHVRATTLDGVLLIVPTPIRDDRGFFSRTLDLAWLETAGLATHFPHHNQSRSTRGVLRGLHVRGGAGEVKLVRCARGSIVDHVVDTRPWSPTFGRTERFVLDDDALVTLYLPPCVAHGFQVVSEMADVCYLHSQPYEAGADLAFAWDDPELGLDWPIDPPIVSARDAGSPRIGGVDLTALFAALDDRQ
jgi:dTDP-4-dehydrorhamnose 3,5-epimerase